MLTSVKQPAGVATGSRRLPQCAAWLTRNKKTRYVDHGWPATDGDDDHAVSELAADRTGALSPFGELTFPLPAEELPYMHPVTVVNR